MADPTQLEFISEAEQRYFAEAVIGEEVRQFLVSSVGTYLRGRAEGEYNRCRDEMFEIEDVYTQEGKKEFLKLKAQAWAASHFTLWCVEAMRHGDEAEVLLNDSREGEER